MTAPVTGAERFVDLHSHSTASDGSQLPGDVVRYAHRAGLSAIALTDHDTLDGVAEARRVGHDLGVRVIAGVELSAHDDELEVHVLGLHLSDTDEIERALTVFRTGRRARAERIVQQLNAIGVPLTLDAVMEQARDAAVGRPHVARAMINEGWARDSRDAFDRYLGFGKAAYVPKVKLELCDAIALVHRAGGLAIMAHPGSAASRAAVERIAAIGMDGIEAKHPSHGAEDVARILALVDHYHLVPSGGSDWHGAESGTRMLGNQRVPMAWLDRQDARVRERAEREKVA
ncbi:MAG: PHP domain-containing protein [Gemmatimonadaceae bacterium]